MEREGRKQDARVLMSQHWYGAGMIPDARNISVDDIKSSRGHCGWERHLVAGIEAVHYLEIIPSIQRRTSQ